MNLKQFPKYYTPINDNIYLAGTFNSWSPNDTRFKFDKQTYKLSFSLPVGSYQYKLTRGSWDTTETNQDGSLMTNRNLQIFEGITHTFNITVSNWDDFKGKHSVVGNVQIIDRFFPYPQFNTTKRIWIYLPNDYYTTTKWYPVVYMHDAQNLFDTTYSIYGGEWRIDETMEGFYQQQKPTAIVVGVETIANRVDELTPYSNPERGGGKADLYVDFLVHDLKPYIDSKFRTKPEREFSSIVGSSHGGLFTFYAGLRNQHVFSRLGIYSPSFWFSNKIFDFALNTTSKYDDMKLYFFCGGKETSYPNMVPDMLNMMNVLSLKGFKNIKSSIDPNGLHHEDYWAKEFSLTYEWLFLN